MKNLHSMLALAALTVAGAASAQQIRTTVDGDVVNFPDVQPQMISGHVMVPVRGVFEHMSTMVDWSSDTQTVTAKRGSDIIQLPLNSTHATINGRDVELDSPATLVEGRMLVPIRFLGESFGLRVAWISATRTVEINSVATRGPANSTMLFETGDSSSRYDAWVSTVSANDPFIIGTSARIRAGTVMPFLMDQSLSSDGSEVGDKFTATLDTRGDYDYQLMPRGTILEGHVDGNRAKRGDKPGVLGLAFDRLRLPDGQTYRLHGSLIDLNTNSVEERNGRLVAKPSGKKDNLKYVGYGAGAGVIVAVLTKGNVLTTALIGGALGYLFGETQSDDSRPRDVMLASGTRFGVRFTRDLAFRTPNRRDALK